MGSLGPALALLLLLPPIITAGCQGQPQPSAEYKKAKAAFATAMADHPEPDYAHPAYADVIELYRKVPQTNGVEHQTAQNMIQEMESKRLAAQRSAALGDRDAQRYEERLKEERAATQASIRSFGNCTDKCQNTRRVCLVKAGCREKISGQVGCGFKHNRTDARRCYKKHRLCKKSCGTLEDLETR
jgi:hypothetical protein